MRAITSFWQAVLSKLKIKMVLIKLFKQNNKLKETLVSNNEYYNQSRWIISAPFSNRKDK